MPRFISLGQSLGNRNWQDTIAFVEEALDHSGHSIKVNAFKTKTAEILSKFRDMAPALETISRRVAGQPPVVLEGAYLVLVPDSPTNCFRTEADRIRNLLIFEILLQMGLRRGELLGLTDRTPEWEFDIVSGEPRFWLTVENAPKEGDGRYSKPSIKTRSSYRQLPVPKSIVNLIELYREHRVRQRHPFLLTSQMDRPLAASSVTRIFHVITESLPVDAKAALARQRLPSLLHPAMWTSYRTFLLGGLCLWRARQPKMGRSQNLGRFGQIR